MTSGHPQTASKTPEAREDINSLMARLPKVRGRISENADLGKQTWFRVGGTADVLFKPQDIDDLQDFLSQLPSDIPVTVLGVASNMIIRDGGIRGVVIRLMKDFTNVEILDGHLVHAGAGATDKLVAMNAAKHDIEGLEFFSGIPGTIGGAVRMNASAYGSETKDVLVQATCIDRKGNIHTVDAHDLNMTYRHTELPDDWIVVSAVFQGRPGQREEIEARMQDIQDKRESTQPVREKTGGSTFANPLPYKSWELIDKAGCRGHMVGGAQMSEKHCNFMINTGDATAFDLEQLGEDVRKKVRSQSDVLLRWEIKRIGEFLPSQSLSRADHE